METSPISTFNLSKYQENEANRWKFLEELDSKDEENIGFLIKSPIPVMIATTSYIVFVCFLGPAIMRKREPFQLKTIIRFYNLLMVFLAAYLLARVNAALGSFTTLLDCNRLFTFADDSGTKVYLMGHLILTVRLSEYLDTIFFTLRKKENQVTFLHVYHHAFVPMYAYWILRTAPLRFNVFIVVINSFIHVLMYFYYFLATFQQSRDASGKKQQKQSLVMNIVTTLLMFKKYMTQLQILQFVSLAVYTVWVGLQKDRCQVPNTYIVSNFLLAASFLGLFLHFYINVYKGSAQSARLKRD